MEADFIQIRRLRLADNVPMAILTNYMPARYPVTEDDLRVRGLYACLNAQGVNLKIAHQQISARLMTADEAELLDEPEPAAGLAVERLAYDDVGRFVEFGRHLYRPGLLLDSDLTAGLMAAQPLRVGIVGFGWMGQVHARAYARLRSTTLTLPLAPTAGGRGRQRR